MNRWTLRIEMREAILIVFFAVFLVAARGAMRWHLHVPGHSMVASTFGLVLVRSCIDRRAAGTVCGCLAGMASAGLGMGGGGPLVALELALPGAVIDLASVRDPDKRASISLKRGLVIGGLAGASGFVPIVLVEWLANVDPQLIAFHGLLSAGGKAAFGAVGGVAGAWVAGELRHHGVLAGANS